MPLVTELTTLPISGFISFKFGPILPTAFASLSEWQAPQFPAFKKISFPKSNFSSENVLLNNNKLNINKKISFTFISLK